MDFGRSRDIISGLPDSLLCHILSFLNTKEAASTSVLAKKWRYLFASVPNLDFDDSVHLRLGKRNPAVSGEDYLKMINEISDQLSTSFMDFVDQVLRLQDNSPLHKFSLKIRDCVDIVRIICWILKVLERGVSDLELDMHLKWKSSLPSKIFLSETLVRLKLSVERGPFIDVEDVHLPKLKTLHIVSVKFEKHGIGLNKLLSGCHILEELNLEYISWCLWDFVSVSLTTLKRLTFCGEVMQDENPISVSFNTPNLVYLMFTDAIADEYSTVNFDSLVEAHINLQMSEDQVEQTRFSDSEGNMEGCMVANATELIMGICNVKILYLSVYTLEVLTYCCEAIPLFNNLTHLTIESNSEVGWESVSGLLKNSPNLETLVFKGLVHRFTDKCGDMCLCKPWEEDEEEEEDEETPTYLSSCPVKVLKILEFGKIYDDEIEKRIDQVKHFLEKIPDIEQLILHYNTPVDEDVIKVYQQLRRHPKVASSKCKLQLISDNLSLSSKDCALFGID
ncbi:putative F-box protein [Arabidopsis thaliana]